MKLFHKHKNWTIQKISQMCYRQFGGGETNPFTRVWYKCESGCINVKDWKGTLTDSEVKDMFPTP